MRIIIVMPKIFIAVLRFEFFRGNSAEFNEIFRESLSVFKAYHNADIFNQMVTVE